MSTSTTRFESWRAFLDDEGFLWSAPDGKEAKPNRVQNSAKGGEREADDHASRAASLITSSTTTGAAEERRSTEEAKYGGEAGEEEEDGEYDETEFLTSNSELWSFSDPWSAIVLSLLLGGDGGKGGRQDVAFMNCFARTFRRNSANMPLLIQLIPPPPQVQQQQGEEEKERLISCFRTNPVFESSFDATGLVRSSSDQLAAIRAAPALLFPEKAVNYRTSVLPDFGLSSRAVSSAVQAVQDQQLQDNGLGGSAGSALEVRLIDVLGTLYSENIKSGDSNWALSVTSYAGRFGCLPFLSLLMSEAPSWKKSPFAAATPAHGSPDLIECVAEYFMKEAKPNSSSPVISKTIQAIFSLQLHPQLLSSFLQCPSRSVWHYLTKKQLEYFSSLSNSTTSMQDDLGLWWGKCMNIISNGLSINSLEGKVQRKRVRRMLVDSPSGFMNLVDAVTSLFFGRSTVTANEENINQRNGEACDDDDGLGAADDHKFGISVMSCSLLHDRLQRETFEEEFTLLSEEEQNKKRAALKLANVSDDKALQNFAFYATDVSCLKALHNASGCKFIRTTVSDVADFVSSSSSEVQWWSIALQRGDAIASEMINFALAKEKTRLREEQQQEKETITIPSAFLKAVFNGVIQSSVKGLRVLLCKVPTISVSSDKSSSGDKKSNSSQSKKKQRPSSTNSAAVFEKWLLKSVYRVFTEGVRSSKSFSAKQRFGMLYLLAAMKPQTSGDVSSGVGEENKLIKVEFDPKFVWSPPSPTTAVSKSKPSSAPAKWSLARNLLDTFISMEPPESLAGRGEEMVMHPSRVETLHRWDALSRILEPQVVASSHYGGKGVGLETIEQWLLLCCQPENFRCSSAGGGELLMEELVYQLLCCCPGEVFSLVIPRTSCPSQQQWREATTSSSSSSMAHREHHYSTEDEDDTPVETSKFSSSRRRYRVNSHLAKAIVSKLEKEGVKLPMTKEKESKSRI